jgi:CheY-like chemotaxis protein
MPGLDYRSRELRSARVIVLLVDDERDTRTVASLALRRLGGFTVMEADSGPEAVEAAARLRPDAVILDVMMPGMDGPSVLAGLRARADTAGIPVLFLTATAMPDELARLHALGARAVLSKPFDPRQFAADVRAALDADVQAGSVHPAR